MTLEDEVKAIMQDSIDVPGSEDTDIRIAAREVERSLTVSRQRKSDVDKIAAALKTWHALGREEALQENQRIKDVLDNLIVRLHTMGFTASESAKAAERDIKIILGAV